MNNHLVVRRASNLKPRSLLLFWAVDHSNLPLFRYLWTFDRVPPLNWGLKNLEFLLLLALDHPQARQIYEVLLEPRPFALMMRAVSFTEAMDFIEDFIINNCSIPEELKLNLLYSPEMALYSFMGALLNVLALTPTEDDQTSQLTDILELYDKLTKADVSVITHCKTAMERIVDLHKRLPLQLSIIAPALEYLAN